MVWDILEEETGARLTHSLRPHRRHGEAADAATSRSMVRAARPDASSHIVEEGEKLAPQEPHLPRPPRERRRHQRRGRASRSAGRGRACARPASPTTSARRTRTSSTTRSTSTCPSARAATARPLPRAASEEIRQSARIIEQALERMADDGPGQLDDPRVVLPAEGRRLHDHRGAPSSTSSSSWRASRSPPASATRTPRAATASSASTSSPTAAARRTACASARRASRSCRASSSSSPGRMMPDIVPTFGSLNMIGGECDH